MVKSMIHEATLSTGLIHSSVSLCFLSPVIPTFFSFSFPLQYSFVILSFHLYFSVLVNHLLSLTFSFHSSTQMSFTLQASLFRCRWLIYQLQSGSVHCVLVFPINQIPNTTPTSCFSLSSSTILNVSQGFF